MSGRRAQSLPSHMLEPVKPQRGRCVTAICFSWKVITCIVSHVTLVLLVVSYCVGGAYLFQHLERPHEIEVKKGIHNLRLNLTDKIWIHSDNLSVLNEVTWTNVVKDDLQMFEKQILTAIKTNGWDGDEDINKSQWTFAGSLFYSIIVITTIGYGHISPRTDWGKVTTIFYAIVGIPLMLLCLSNIGDVMATSFRFIYWRVCCYVCTRTSKKSRARARHRSSRHHRYSSRSQPPPIRRSTKTSQRSAHGSGLKHAYSDPELRNVERNEFDYERQADRRMHRSDNRRGIDRRQEHLLNMSSAPRSNNRHMAPYDDDPYYFPDDGPSYTQTLNRGARFCSRQSKRERIRDRHTVERERHLSRSKQYFDAIDDDIDLPRTKRAMSVRSIRASNLRKDEILKDSRDPRDLNRLHLNHNITRGKSVPNSNSGRIRAKSVDPRLSSAQFEEVDEEVVRKTPIISNRYAISEMEHQESRNKSHLRSQSMPKSAFYKNTLINHMHPRNYEDDSANQVNNPRHKQPRRASLGIQHGQHLELPEISNHYVQGMKRGVSPRNFDCYEEDYDETFLDEPDHMYNMSHRSSRHCNDMEYQHSPKSSSRRKKSPRREKQERLPPSPRIMSPMGFAVKRQIRRRPSYDYDDDSQYGDERSDFYGDISPKDRPVPIWLCVFLVISYILGGAALFAYWENWSFLDSAYFCFITLTTIGFGDFVPAKGVKDESQQSIAYCSLYLLFGIALLAMSFNLVQEEFIANVKEVARRLGILKDDDIDDDYDD